MCVCVCVCMYLPPLLNRRTDPDEILGVAPFGRRTDPRLPGDPGSPPRGYLLY